MKHLIFPSDPSAPYTLRNARVPNVLLEPALLAFTPDTDGLVLCDIAIRDGLIASITPPEPSQPGDPDLGGGQVWPCFTDVHTHLDKGHIWPRAGNADGTHGTAARTVATDRAQNWSADDIAARFDFGLRCAYAHGTSAIRTHLDSYEMGQAETAWAVFGDMARNWRGRIDLQAVCMTRLDMYAGATGDRLAALAAANGGCLGGILKMGLSVGVPEADAIDTGLARLFSLATDHGLDIDLHLDETGDPSARTLAQVARAALEHRFEGQVTCGHCCSLAVQDDDVAAETIALVARAGLNIVTLPMINLYLQGRRAGETPRWRGLTLVHELAASGVRVAAASDNCRDPFFAFGDHDMLEVLREFIRIAHADAPDWARCVTVVPSDIMRRPEAGRLNTGAPADLVLFAARSPGELHARPQHDRIVLRRGQKISTDLPDYRELDGLMKKR